MKRFMEAAVIHLVILGVARCAATNPPPAGKQEPEAATKAEQKPAELKTFKTWTSASGTQIEADYLQTTGGTVTFQKKDGSPVKIGLTQLSAEDREHIQKIEAQPRTTRESEDKLPVFTRGPHKGLHAATTREKYDIEIRADTVVLIYPKDEGQRIARPMSLHPSCWYLDRSDNRRRHIGRPIVLIEPAPEPTAGLPEFRLTGKLKDDVAFEVFYAFGEDSVQFRGWCEDPKAITWPTRFRYTLHIPPSHAIEPKVELSERKQILRGHTLFIEEIERIGSETKKTRVAYPYWKSMHFRYNATEARLEVPVYGSRRVEIRTREPGDALLTPHIYSGNALWQGYAFLFTKREPDSRSKDEVWEILIH